LVVFDYSDNWYSVNYREFSAIKKELQTYYRFGFSKDTETEYKKYNEVKATNWYGKKIYILNRNYVYNYKFMYNIISNIHYKLLCIIHNTRY